MNNKLRKCFSVATLLLLLVSSVYLVKTYIDKYSSNVTVESGVVIDKFYLESETVEEVYFSSLGFSYSEMVDYPEKWIIVVNENNKIKELSVDQQIYTEISIGDFYSTPHIE